MKSLKQFLKEKAQESNVQITAEEFNEAKAFLISKGYPVENNDTMEFNKIQKFITRIAFARRSGEEINLRELYKRFF